MLNPYEMMYDTTMDVYRRISTEGVDGLTRPQNTLVTRGVKCRYSSSGQTSTKEPNAAIQNSHRLFCGLETDIREGDLIVVVLRGKKISLNVGECHPYTYQWQCEVTRNDEA